MSREAEIQNTYKSHPLTCTPTLPYVPISIIMQIYYSALTQKAMMAELKHQNC